MSQGSRIGVIGLALCVLAGIGFGDENLDITSAPGQVSAKLPDGSLAWRVILPRLDNSVLLDRFGRVLGRELGLSGSPGDAPVDWFAPLAEWDTPVEITAPPPAQTSDSHRPPLFDSNGDAWVIITNIKSGAYSLQVRRSNGHDGSWGPLETVRTTTRYVANVEGTIDSNDNINVVFREISGGYKLYSARYEPGVGWSAAKQIHSTSNFFQAIEVGADELGNVVAVFDPESGGDAVWSIVYDAGSGAWGSAKQVSPTGYDILLPTILRNDTGTGMYLVYLVRGGGPVGLYAHTWDSAARSWSGPELLPGSEVAGYSLAGPSSRYPGVVDAAGNATVFWENAYPGPYSPYASRREAGVWQNAVQLLPLDPHSVDVENFSGAGVSIHGDVYGVVTRYETAADLASNRFYALPYRAGIGWLAAENPYNTGLSVSTRVRVAFYQGCRAVGTALGSQSGQAQLTSLLHDGTDWLPDLLDIPGQEVAYFADLASDQGEVLLVYEAEAGGNQGIKAAFLRDPHPGDVNCDCELNFGDINPFVLLLTNRPAWEAAFPDCDPMNGDCDQDGLVDFGDINPFVRLLAG